MSGAPPLRQMMQRLIAQPSVSSAVPALDMPNAALIEELAGWLESAGFAVQCPPVPGMPGKHNLIARAGPGEDGLVLSGHTDTVPFDEAGWRSDPFRLTETDGRLYGLGSSDMKLFLALAIEAARGFDLTRLTRPLVILATADEESSMAGARALVAAGQPLGRYAVIGEPTGLRPVRSHKGTMMERIRVLGRSGHASDPALGANALDGMARVLQALIALRDDLARRHRDPDFAVPYPTLNLGKIAGGDNPNRICGECELLIDLRPLPGMDTGALRAEVRACAAEALAGSPLRLQCESLFDGLPALATPPASAIVQFAGELTQHVPGTAAFGTEGPYLQRLGCEVVILGPGDIAQAHQPDEYLAAERIEPTVELLAALIERFCAQ